ncbi:ComEC/Rec2 family competence protein, partial [Candidatus Uhrbacteria bacterium]|nr:ComEC/Rec2 family competence protein [Candidatus Uhrbacteria bacterium]
MRFPRTVGAVSGWMMTAFILAVGLHSHWRFVWFPSWAWVTAFVALAVVTCFVVGARSPRPGGAIPPIRPTFAVVLILLSFILGWWRVEAFSFPSFRRIGNHEIIVKAKDETTMLARWRAFVTARIASAMPQEQATLISGILYGDQDLSKEQREAFVTSGLMHIVAVSGSNVTIVVQVLSFCLLGIGLRRRHAFIGTSVALILFVGFVGGAASVMRAAFMGWLLLVGREVGRLVSPFRLLLVAAVILLLVDPWQLLFSASFALSFLAMWGILAWPPVFERGLAFVPTWFGLRQTMAMTLGATIMTAPYLAWSFGRLTLLGLLSNLLALPLTPFAMGAGTLAAAWGPLPGAVLVSAPAAGIAQTIQSIAGLASYLPWLDLRVQGMDLSTCIATYALLVHLWRQYSDKNGLSTR